MPTIKRTKTGAYTTIAYLGRDVDGKEVNRRITEESQIAVRYAVEDARRRFREEQEQIAEERAQAAAGRPDPKRTTVLEAVERYIASEETRSSPSTIRAYISYKKNMFPALMPLTVAELTEICVQDAIDEEAGKCSPKTLKNRWNLLRPAVRAVDKTFFPDAELPPVRRKRFQMPEVDRLMLLFELVEGKAMEIPVLLAATCGLRRGEISALDLWKDFDDQKMTVTVERVFVENKNHKWELKEYPKTDAGLRVVVVPDWVMEKIKKTRDDPEYRMLKPFAITNRFKTLQRKTGISCTLHGLRHYYASVMSSLNIPEQYQMERMGHSTNYMLKRYQEYLKQTEVDIDKNLQNYMNALNPRKPD